MGINIANFAVPQEDTADLPSSVGNARSTDGTYGLPTPTGVGLELIINTVNGTPGLQDIRFNGVSQ